MPFGHLKNNKAERDLFHWMIFPELDKRVICIIAPRDNRSNLFDFLEAYGDSLYSITLTGNKTIKIKTTVDP